MSLHCPNPAPQQPNPSCNMNSHQLPQHQPTLPKPTHQPTIWNFVHKKLAPISIIIPEPPTPTPLLPTPDTQSPTTLTPTEQLLNDTPTKTQHQNVLNQPSSNDAWGKVWAYTQNHDNFRVISKNLSTLHPYVLDMLAIVMEFDAQQTSMFLAQETNTAWKPSALQAIKTQCYRVTRHSKISTSSSKDSTKNTYQPGGTLTLALGKWASHIISWGSDEILG